MTVADASTSKEIERDDAGSRGRRWTGARRGVAHTVAAAGSTAIRRAHRMRPPTSPARARGPSCEPSASRYDKGRHRIIFGSSPLDPTRADEPTSTTFGRSHTSFCARDTSFGGGPDGGRRGAHGQPSHAAAEPTSCWTRPGRADAGDARPVSARATTSGLWRSSPTSRCRERWARSWHGGCGGRGSNAFVTSPATRGKLTVRRCCWPSRSSAGHEPHHA